MSLPSGAKAPVRSDVSARLKSCPPKPSLVEMTTVNTVNIRKFGREGRDPRISGAAPMTVLTTKSKTSGLTTKKRWRDLSYKNSKITAVLCSAERLLRCGELRNGRASRNLDF
jgi:hypothetical protein